MRICRIGIAADPVPSAVIELLLSGGDETLSADRSNAIFGGLDARRSYRLQWTIVPEGMN